MGFCGPLYNEILEIMGRLQLKCWSRWLMVGDIGGPKRQKCESWAHQNTADQIWTDQWTWNSTDKIGLQYQWQKLWAGATKLGSHDTTKYSEHSSMLRHDYKICHLWHIFRNCLIILTTLCSVLILVANVPNVLFWSWLIHPVTGAGPETWEHY